METGTHSYRDGKSRIKDINSKVYTGEGGDGGLHLGITDRDASFSFRDVTTFIRAMAAVRTRARLVTGLQRQNSV